MAKNRLQLRHELQRVRRDAGGIFHEPARYNQVIDEALREVPLPLWRTAIDTSVSTTADQTSYTLAAIGNLTMPGQVRRVWLDDGQGEFDQVGRWEVIDDEGVLALSFDNEPPTGRTIRLELFLPHPALANDSTTCTMDEDWVVARAMVNLLLEADERYENPDNIAKEVQWWDGKRLHRERELQRQTVRGARKVRTQAW